MRQRPRWRHDGPVGGKNLDHYGSDSDLEPYDVVLKRLHLNLQHVRKTDPFLHSI